jgi:regulator of sirC expression with transglutaminase-like and TPR domain
MIVVRGKSIGAVALVLCVGLALAGWGLSGSDGQHQVWVRSSTKDGAPASLGQLFSLTTNQLAAVDIALVNLLCAEGLPRMTGITRQQAQGTLDAWANRVASETERNLHQFRENPAEFNNSEACFRMLALVTVLQQDFGVHYDPGQIGSMDYSDSSSLFLQGVLGPKRQGTCLSMPVLYVAVGRRLGYPLKLVTTKAHLFARWESSDGSERLNLEATNQGLNCYPDEYYRSWPIPVNDAELRECGYLKSLSREEEFAVFLAARGHCLQANGRFAEAQLAQAQAHVLVPKSPVYLAFLAGAVKREMPTWRQVEIDLGQTAFGGGEHQRKE